MAANKKINLSVYTIIHFIVDLSCIFYLMGMIYIRMPHVSDTLKAAVIYNMFAFALPMVLGFFVDVIGKNALVSAVGCFVIVLAYLITPAPWAAVAMIGVGNGLFHLGGGRHVLQDAERKYAPPGIFIASGAMGVYLGRTMSGGYRALYLYGMEILLGISCLLLIFFAVKQRKINIRSIPSKQKLSSRVLLLSLLIFLVVIIRSYYGFMASYSWNNGFVIGLVFTFCVLLGKALGGVLADLLGVRAASVISLAGAGVLALWAPSSPVMGCASILLFNMTMPITLTLLSEQWKELPGFAFGTLMMALFIGTLPPMLLKIRWLSQPWGLLILCLLSLIILMAVITADSKREE